MSEMIERVAKAIALADFGTADEWAVAISVHAARAAMEAMREPTSKMNASACNALKKHIESFSDEERARRWEGRQDAAGWRVPNKEKHRVRYQAMIDAALKTP